MDRSKRNARLEAAKAFMASLDQLGNVLSEEDGASAPTEVVSDKSQPKPLPDPSPENELDAFEQALADIEALMQEQSTEK